MVDKFEYRPDIDGLRAVAAALVLVFHAKVFGISGGFVGVDIFLVISGYLITAILRREIHEKRFTAGGFYLRRIRRIFPLLFFVLLISAFVFGSVLGPSLLRDFGQSLIASFVMGSNFLFALESNYFGPASDLKPLLHTWSLSLEEQFYLIFPIALIFGARLRRDWLIVLILIIATASFVFSIVFGNYYPNQNYYLLPGRAWQLLAGAFLAVVLERKLPSISRVFADSICLIALLVIFVSGAMLNASQAGPHWAVLPTVLSVMCIIAIGAKSTLMQVLLGNAPLVFLGKISFGTYLWHQPIFVFYRYEISQTPTALEYFALIILSHVFAVISWALIERPFRNKSAKFGHLPHWSLLPVGILGLFMGSSFLDVEQNTNAYLSNMHPEAKQMYEYANKERQEVAKRYRTGLCFDDHSVKNGQVDFYISFAECGPAVDPAGTKTAIWGDSHAAALHLGFSELGSQIVGQFTVSACPPGLHRDFDARPGCSDANSSIARVIKTSGVTKLYLHAHWRSYDKDALQFGIVRFLDEVSSHEYTPEIILVGGVPNWGNKGLPELLIDLEIQNTENVMLRPALLDEVREYDSFLEELALTQNVSFISLIEILCDQNKCLAASKENDALIPSAWDSAHISRATARSIVNEIVMKDK